jgi:hypothetical protein
LRVSLILRPFIFFRQELLLKGSLSEYLQRPDLGTLTPERKRALYLGFFGSALFALFAVYWGGLTRGPFVDDNFLLFANPRVREAANPLFYWYRGQSGTKAWPLTHTAFWLLYQVFGARFWAYRSLNVLLHWASGVFLFHFLARKVRLSSAAFGACLFWFHPVAVGSVTWIAQLSTLGTVLFLGWWMARMDENEDGTRAGFLPFLAMVLSKGFAYLLPIVQLRKRLNSSTVAKAFLFTAPSFAVAGYGLFLAFVGTYYDPNDRPFLQTYYQTSNPVPAAPAAQPVVALKAPSAPVKAKKKKKPSKGLEKKTPVAQVPAVLPVLAPEIVSSAASPTHVLTQSLPERITLVGKTFVFYAARFVSFSDIFPEMRFTQFAKWSTMFLVIGLGVLALLAWALVSDYRILAAGLLVYLPVSGLFYVPFFKRALVSDHMIYPAFFLFTWGVGLCVDKIRHNGLRRAYWLWPVLLTIFTVVEVRAVRVEFPVESAMPFHEGAVK